MTKPGRSRTTTLMLLAIVLLFMGIGMWFAQREDRARDEALAPTPIASETEKDATVLAEPSVESTKRVEAAQPALPTTSIVEAAAPSTPPARPRVEGRVLDITGIPVADAVVTIETPGYADAPQLAMSGPDGSFQFEPVRDELRLIAHAASWRPLRSQVWRADNPLPGLIVVAPCITLKGEVVDQAGAIVPKAMISIRPADTILARFPYSLDASTVMQQWSQSVDREGRFAIKGATCAPGTTFVVNCAEYKSCTLPVPSDPTKFVRVVLERDDHLVTRTIRGIVVRHDGEPATKAVVRFGPKQTETDAHGEFELSCPVPRQRPRFGEASDWDEQFIDSCALVAIEAGSRAAIVADFGRVLMDNTQDPPPQKLFLGPAPLSIRGHVLDARRQPLSGYWVTLVDPTPVSTGNPLEASAEQLASGNDAAPGARGVKTDEQGAFELGGLFERRYRLQAFSNKSMARLESAEIPAGSHDVELVLGADVFVPEITGRVVGRDREDIGGAKIALVVMSARTVNADGGQGGAASTGRDVATTAPDGSFRIENVPRHGSELRLSGMDLIGRTVTLKDLDLEHPLVIQLDRARKFRIEGLPAKKAQPPIIAQWARNNDTLRLLALDAQQNELRASRSTNSQYNSTNQLELGDDPAEIYTVSEAAVEVVLYAHDGTLLGRRPVRLVPGGVCVVTW